MLAASPKPPALRVAFGGTEAQFTRGKTTGKEYRNKRREGIESPWEKRRTGIARDREKATAREGRLRSQAAGVAAEGFRISLRLSAVALEAGCPAVWYQRARQRLEPSPR